MSQDHIDRLLADGFVMERVAFGDKTAVVLKRGRAFVYWWEQSQ